MKRIPIILTLGIAICSAAFSQNIEFPNTFGLGISTGMLGGDAAFSIDLTSPYLHILDNGYVALRLSGDVLAKEGIQSGSSTYSILWPGYFTNRLGLVMARVPNDFMRLYGEVGGTAIFPTSSLASSTNPTLGLYVTFGGEFFVDKTKHTAFFLEAGDSATFGSPAADKLQGAPILANGPSVTAGVRYYF